MELKSEYAYTIDEIEVLYSCAEGGEFYHKSEADKVIAEKDEEARKLKRALWLQRVKTAKTEIRYWRERLFNEPAATRAGIHGQRLIPRNLVRTIREWLSIWDSVEHKCQAKAEEYK